MPTIFSKNTVAWFNLEMPPPSLRGKLRPHFLFADGHSVLFNGCITWSSWRRLLVWWGLSTQKSIISAALKSHGADNTVTHMEYIGYITWRHPDYPRRASFNELTSEAAIRIFYVPQTKLCRKKCPWHCKRWLSLLCELPIAPCPGKAHPVLWSLDQKDTLQ